jgi:hypothetical protein
MSKTHSYKAIVSLLLLLAVLYSSAQQKTTVKATVDKNKILIGEPIQITLEADIPINEPIHFFAIDTIPHFEISARQKNRQFGQGRWYGAEAGYPCYQF